MSNRRKDHLGASSSEPLPVIIIGECCSRQGGWVGRRSGAFTQRSAQQFLKHHSKRSFQEPARQEQNDLERLPGGDGGLLVISGQLACVPLSEKTQQLHVVLPSGLQKGVTEAPALQASIRLNHVKWPFL